MTEPFGPREQRRVRQSAARHGGAAGTGRQRPDTAPDSLRPPRGQRGRPDQPPSPPGRVRQAACLRPRPRPPSLSPTGSRCAGTALFLAARTIRCQGDYRSSAAITVLFARALTGLAVASRPGVLFPEEAVTLDDLRPGLASAGITISEEKMA